MGMEPETFWNMTLVEWRAALAGHAMRRGFRARAAGESLSRAEFADLMLRFPDTGS